MTLEPYIAALAGLVGALIGAAASIATIVIQARVQARRDRTKEALVLALEDWKAKLELAKDRGGLALPMAVYVHYHMKLLELAEKGDLTGESMKALSAEQSELIKAIKEAQASLLNASK